MIRDHLGDHPIVLVGLMGAGKSSVGRRLADKLGFSFVDADHEIEAAAGTTISEIFADHGEDYFRDGERRVIARLLAGGAQVLATGGGAYINDETRARINECGVTSVSDILGTSDSQKRASACVTFVVWSISGMSPWNL